MLSMSVALSLSGGVAMRYVLPVLCMTSCLYIMTRYKQRNSDAIKSCRPVDLSPWRILKLTHQGAAADQGGV